MTSLIEVLRESARRYPHHPAVMTPEMSVDFASFDRLSDRVAASLAQRGVRKGDRVGLYCINSDAFAIAYVGIVKAGAVVIPINLLLKPQEIAFILNDASARALIYYGGLEQNVQALRQMVPSLALLVCIGADPTLDQAVSWQALLDTQAPLPQPEIDPDQDLAAVLYTSGTTGRPKGAMLTHGNLMANAASVREAMEWRPGRDRVLLVLPMFHAFAATVGMLAPLTCGCAFVPLVRFDPEQVARSIQVTSATIFLGVPSLYAVLLRLKEDQAAAFQSLRLCVSGGAALPVEVMRRFEEKFGKPIYEGDGPTECSPVTCVNPINGKIKPGTVGLPVPRVEMKIMDEKGQELPPGEVGEIAVRGPNVMKGYWNLPDETRAVFRGKWFLTGDLGTRDEEGYFSIVDRKKDLLIVNGMNVYPRMIEEVLYRHEAVKEAAVVGEASALHGEIPIAYVALAEGSKATARDIRRWCCEHLGRHEAPKKIFIVPELPKNAAGKIVKRQLRKDGEIERGIDQSE